MKGKDSRVTKNEDQNLLDSLRIASPCNVDWDSMTGDERVRFCGQCKRNVYNISEMSRGEAATLMRKSESELPCIRMYKRRDGTVITDDCPVGIKKLRKLRDRARAIASAAASAIAWMMFPGVAGAQQSTSGVAVDDGNPSTAIEIRKSYHGKRSKIKVVNDEAWRQPMGVPAPIISDQVETPTQPPPTGSIEIKQGNTAAITDDSTFTSQACTVPQESQPLGRFIGLAALAMTGMGAFFAWRKKKASLWLLGSIVAVILVVTGLIWGLSDRMLLELAPWNGGGLS